MRWLRIWLVVLCTTFNGLAWPYLAMAEQALGPITVQGGPWMLAGRAFSTTHLSPHPHLVLVLHGDAPFVNPGYQYAFAQAAAGSLDDAVVVGLLRPGYKDDMSGESQGARGWTTGDNYTADRIASIVAAARTLMARFHASDLTLVGHSGGATIAADIVGLYPHLARGVLLVSCPCDVPAFRWSMFEFQWNPLWLWPVGSISPQSHVNEIPPDTIVRLVIGSEDPIAPPRLTKSFAAALKQHGGNVAVKVETGKGHEILLEPEVLNQLKVLMAAN